MGFLLAIAWPVRMNKQQRPQLLKSGRQLCYELVPSSMTVLWLSVYLVASALERLARQYATSPGAMLYAALHCREKAQRATTKNRQPNSAK